MNKSLTIGDVGEKRLLREYVWPYLKKYGDDYLIGDDAAIFDIEDGKQIVVSTDKIPEDLLSKQFDLISPWQHGRYLAQVNISDIAAMGGRPLALLATLGLPANWLVSEFAEFIRGIADGAAESGARLIGGDLGWAPSASLSATAIGEIPRNSALVRSGAKIGDKVFLSGEVGSFSAALIYFGFDKGINCVLDDDEKEHLLRRLIMPTARVDIGLKLSEIDNCSSCMDITDGLKQSIVELSELSHVDVRIFADALPIHKATRKVACALGIDLWEMIFGIGLDLELIGTISGAIPNDLDGDLTYIGDVHDGTNCLVIENDVIALPGIGWQHLGNRAIDHIRKLIETKNIR